MRSAKPFECEVLAMQRNDDGVGSYQRVQRQQAERRGAVDEDQIKLPAKRVEHPAKAILAIGHVDELDFRAGEISIGGND